MRKVDLSTLSDARAVNADYWADIASTLLKRPNDLQTEESADSAVSVIDQQTGLPNLVDQRPWLVLQFPGSVLQFLVLQALVLRCRPELLA